MGGRITAVAILSLMVMACGATLSPSKRAAISPNPAAGGSLGSIGSAGCAPAATFHGWGSPSGLPEGGFDSPRGSLWALFFNPVPRPLGAKQGAPTAYSTTQAIVTQDLTGVPGGLRVPCYALGPRDK